jgi:CO/xanthine dehydrogenase Mo-binding subunit
LPDGRVEALSGRVELGQGVRTALAQVVAAELGVPVEEVVVRSAATDATPDEGYTSGSASLEQGGGALAAAAAAFRRLRAAGMAPVGPIEETDRPTWTGTPLGADTPRTDLATKLTGAGYVHDLELPGMVHGRALLPPAYDARPASIDLDAIRAQPGVLAAVHDGGLVFVVTEREEQAVRAVRQLAENTRWDNPGLEPDPISAEPVPPAGWITARYTKPAEAHAAVAPSCAVAVAEPDRLTVWTHSQGVFPLRRELATVLGEDESRLTVRHLDGPGCYGQNGADDVAGFAALAARAVPGRPVRFQFSVSDELTWEPYGPPMDIELAAALDHSGRIAGWRARVRTGPHTGRPHGSGDRLAVAWLRSSGPPRPWTGGGVGGGRNAVPIYEVGEPDINVEYVATPLRTSALRSLGAYGNVFAIESFMDELAEAAGVDPLAFRLAHLADARARTVLETAAQHAGWRTRRGQGLALARYNGNKAYVAQVVDVEVRAGTIAVRKVTTVCDAGTVVNPDGLRNQLEGGTLQGLSRALYEQVRYTPDGVTSRDWTSYPVLRFAGIPALETILVDRPGLRPLGAGEAATPVTPAALANAVHDAVGVRVRTLPLRLPPEDLG